MPPRKARRGSTSSTTSSSSKVEGDAGESKGSTAAQKRPRKARKAAGDDEATTPAQQDAEQEGDKGKNDKEADFVAIIRTFIFLQLIITNCFIVGGNIRHWNDHYEKPHYELTEQ